MINADCSPALCLWAWERITLQRWESFNIHIISNYLASMTKTNQGFFITRLIRVKYQFEISVRFFIFLERNSNFSSTSPHVLWQIYMRVIEVFRPSPITKYPNKPPDTEGLLLRTARISPRTRNLLLERYPAWIAIWTVSNGLSGLLWLANHIREETHGIPHYFCACKATHRTWLGHWRLRRHTRLFHPHLRETPGHRSWRDLAKT